jgi:hypothetical protein
MKAENHAGRKREPHRGATRFPGICADAAALSISRQHLFQVLTGRRTSDGLRSRYDALRAEKLSARPANGIGRQSTTIT